MKRALLLLIVGLLVTACSSRDLTLSERISALYRSQEPVLDLSVAEPSAWDRVCVFSPYSTSDLHGRRTLGFSWDMDHLTLISSNEGISLLVFASGQHVVAFAEHPRVEGDFAHLGGRCFVRDRAKFQRETRAGVVVLQPVENRTSETQGSPRAP